MNCGIAVCLVLVTAPALSFAAGGNPAYVTASFVDRNGLFIENLDKSEVEILENGQIRPIEFMARDELPGVYGIIFERAMLPEIAGQARQNGQFITNDTAARNMAYELIDKLLGRQTLWVGAYDRDLEIPYDAASDGFGAKNAILQLSGLRRSTDGFLYAALFSAVTKMNQRHEKRRVIILFLEGIDSETATKLKQMKNLLMSSNVELFVVCFASRLGNSGSVPFAGVTAAVKEIAQATAGTALFSMEYRDHYDEIVQRILNQVRTFYTFGFTSGSDTSNPGKLLIRCSRPNSRVRNHPYVPVLK